MKKLWLLLFLLPNLAWATPSIVQSVSVDGTSVVMPHPAAGHLLVAGIRAGTSQSLSNFVDSINDTWVLDGSQIDGEPPDGNKIYVRYVKSTIGSSGNVTFTATVTGGTCRIIVVEIANADPTNPVRTHASTNGSSLNPVTGYTTGQALEGCNFCTNEILLAFMETANGVNTLSPGVGFTTQQNVLNKLMAESETVTPFRSFQADSTIAGTTTDWWAGYAVRVQASDSLTQASPTPTSTASATATATSTPTPTATAQATPSNFICIAPTPTGDGSGSNWSNKKAWGNVTFARNNTYYVSTASNYAGKTFPALSGASPVIVKKATQADHGTDGGWDNNTMGVGTAVFTVAGDYTFVCNMTNLTIDGVSGGDSANPNAKGIKLVTTGTTQSNGSSFYAQGSSSSANLVLKHIEMVAPDPNGNLSNFNLFLISADNALIQYCYIHGGLVGVYLRDSNQILDHCYVQNCGGQVHSEMVDLPNTQNVILRYNVFRDLLAPNATTYIEPQVNGGTVPNGIYVYGNVFWGSSANEGSNNPSMFSSTSNEVVSNAFIYNNTAYGLHGCSPSVGYADTGIWGSSTGSTITAKNNLWVNCAKQPGFGPAPSVTHDYNFSSGSSADIGSEGHGIINGQAACMVDPDNGDFHLNDLGGQFYPRDHGVMLNAPFDKDPDNNTRGFGGFYDIGAYENVNTPQTLVEVFIRQLFKSSDSTYPGLRVPWRP